MASTIIPPEYLAANDFGFTAVDSLPTVPVDMSADKITILKGNIHTLEQIIVPLLLNLIKTANSAYIHWPNRAPACQGYLDKVLAITRKADA